MEELSDCKEVIFDEAKGLSKVAEFHDLFDLPVIDKPIIPAKERCKLRISLLEEELKELKEAIEEDDIVEVADAFCDIQYVLSGAIHEFGMGDVFADMFAEVHRSNMSKACLTMEEAERTQEKYRREKDTVSHIKGKGDKFLVYRKTDGKVLKSVEYSPASLEQWLKSSI